MMETLQEVVRSSSQSISSPNKEAYVYSGGQGSPTPGETASPQSYFQQSPSLPTSGLTEFNSAGTTSWDPPPDQPSELTATSDPAFTSSDPPKQYMGVRVKMPVRELLKKIRLSKGIDSNSGKEISGKAETKETLGRPGGKRVHSGKRHRLKRYHSPIATKSVEDLDILVEVLEEDLSKSHPRIESQVPWSHLDGAGSGFQPCWWWEADGNQQPDGNHLGNSWESTKWQQHCSLLDPGALWHGCTKHLNGPDDRVMQLCPDPITVQLHSDVEARHGQGPSPFLKSMGNFQGVTREFGSQCCSLPGHIMSEPPGNDSAALQMAGQLKPNSRALWEQETSDISFFQFQLYQEESQLRNIPQERLIEPDTNGNSLLHKAVAQGKRAPDYALAWRLALLDWTDQEDERKQTALHVAAQRNYHLIVSDLVSLGANANKRDGSEKTPLHLCAERGYPRVLENSTTVPGPDGMALSYLQGDPELPSFAGIFQDFPEGSL